MEYTPLCPHDQIMGAHSARLTFEQWHLFSHILQKLSMGLWAHIGFQTNFNNQDQFFSYKFSNKEFSIN